jgi:imidazolonepropionase-like amidohydrolase
VAATRNAGEFAAQHFRAQDRFGIIAPGQRADLVLVAANPLEDITALRQPIAVMARGNWLEQADLQQLLQSWRASTN